MITKVNIICRNEETNRTSSICRDTPEQALEVIFKKIEQGYITDPWNDFHGKTDAIGRYMYCMVKRVA